MFHAISVAAVLVACVGPASSASIWRRQQPLEKPGAKGPPSKQTPAKPAVKGPPAKPVAKEPATKQASTKPSAKVPAARPAAAGPGPRAGPAAAAPQPKPVVSMQRRAHDDVPAPKVAEELSANGLVMAQRSQMSKFDRYPVIFTGLKRLIQKTAGLKAPLKILSFGCADGAEVRTLRRYLPHAIVHGLDIDEKLIKRIAANNSDPNVTYFYNPDDMKAGSYDVVMAMSILCRYGEGSWKLPFSIYKPTLEKIDTFVRPHGGWLVVYNSNYLLSTTPVADHYENYGQKEPDFCFDSGAVPKFTPDGQPLSNKGWDHPYVFFRRK